MRYSQQLLVGTCKFLFFWCCTCQLVDVGQCLLIKNILQLLWVPYSPKNAGKQNLNNIWTPLKRTFPLVPALVLSDIKGVCYYNPIVSAISKTRARSFYYDINTHIRDVDSEAQHNSVLMYTVGDVCRQKISHKVVNLDNLALTISQKNTPGSI